MPHNHYEMPHAQPPLLRVESSGWRPIGRQSIFLRSNEFYHRSLQLGAISHDQLGKSGSASSSQRPVLMQWTTPATGIASSGNGYQLPN
jgi:hypothetical protein